MKIALLSGKGGTGKTLVSVNLAQVAGQAIYLDCDVEEPNGHLFFKPVLDEVKPVTVKIPVVDQAQCDGCRKCVDFCKFNALAYIQDRLLVFEAICHACGGCRLVCPREAITEKDKAIGRLERGQAGQVRVHTGIMNPGEVSGTPLVAALLESLADDPDLPVFIDCPPGSGCLVMDTVAGADYCVLVAEPTLFGAHNLDMVARLVRFMGKPLGVVLNKYQDDRNPIESYCREHDLPLLAKIPFDHHLGLANSKGQIIVDIDPHYRDLFKALLHRIEEEVKP